MTTIENIPRIVIWAVTWIIAGTLTYFMDKAMTRNTTEFPFPFWRAIWAGYIGFFMILGLILFPPTNIEEDEGYTEN